VRRNTIDRPQTGQLVSLIGVGSSVILYLIDAMRESSIDKGQRNCVAAHIHPETFLFSLLMRLHADTRHRYQICRSPLECYR
jgi:hypothetical protein